jgi:hypothetical protein
MRRSGQAGPRVNELASRAKVHLRLLARAGLDAHRHPRLRRLEVVNEAPNGRVAARVAMVLAQPVEDGHQLDPLPQE